jgi:hypothetical protein
MESYNIIKKISLLVLVIMLTNACTKDFKELNTPENLLSEELVTPEYLLSGAQVSAQGGLTVVDAGNYAGMTVRVDNGPFNDNFDDGAWDAAYPIGNNLAAIIRKTGDKPELVNKKAIARILKVWVYSQATDIYGDIPYTDANKTPEEAIPNPKYDIQSIMYQDFFKELKEAVAELDESKESYGNADLYFGGDITKWKKFANSLRLRLALRIRYADQQMAIDNMNDLQETDLILSRSDDAAIYTNNDVEGQRNRAYNEMVSTEPVTYIGRQLVGKALLDAMVGTSDPRNPLDPRTKVIADTAKAKWPPSLGLPYFGFRAQPLLGFVPVENKYPYDLESTSIFSLFWYVPVIERPILKSSEMYFALAEAALFNLKSGDADIYFKKGIEAGIIEVQDLYNKGKTQLPEILTFVYGNDFDVEGYLDYKEMKQSEIDAFLASSATTLSGSDEEKLEQIINQKLIALYPNELEGWSEWRRTGYPRVLVAPNEMSFLKGVSPRRKHYPFEESLINGNNFREASDRMGGTDDLLDRVWWDANPDAPHKHPGAVERRDTPWL